jgi:DNA-binding Lrp family transcriptional regulator
MILDSINELILRILEQNSSYTIKQLSEKVNLSPTAVNERIHKLEKEGIIKYYSAKLDKDKLGLSLTVFCFIKLSVHDKQKVSLVLFELKNCKEIKEIYNISGEYDFLLKIITKDMKSYQEVLMKKISEIEEIGHINSIFVMSEIKTDYSLV